MLFALFIYGLIFLNPFLGFQGFCRDFNFSLVHDLLYLLELLPIVALYSLSSFDGKSSLLPFSILSQFYKGSSYTSLVLVSISSSFSQSSSLNSLSSLNSKFFCSWVLGFLPWLWIRRGCLAAHGFSMRASTAHALAVQAILMASLVHRAQHQGILVVPI